MAVKHHWMKNGIVNFMHKSCS